MRIDLMLLIVHICCITVSAQTTRLVRIRFVNPMGNPIATKEIEIRAVGVQKILTEQAGFILHFEERFEKGALFVNASGFQSQHIPIAFSAEQQFLDLGDWPLSFALADEIEAPLLQLSDLELWSASDDRESIGMPLQAQRDLFLSAAAFQFGSAFFKLRGLDSSHRTIRINGIPMNHPLSGRPNWSQWGGLNDFTNAAGITYHGLSKAPFDIGGALGSLQFELRPSKLRRGTKFSQAFSNASYQFRTMFSRVDRLKEWDYALLLSTRQARQGYMEGTSYHAYSFSFLLERYWNSNNQSWLALFYTPNKSGKSAPLTQEVFDLKGRQYNPYWGWQNKSIRNTRIKSTRKPTLLFSHRYLPNPSTIWQINLGFQVGLTYASRLQHQGHWIEGQHLVGGGSHPSPVYYQKLPSYFLRNRDRMDFQKAHLAREELQKNGQINWHQLYAVNNLQPAAVYFMSADVEQHKQTSFTLQYQNTIDSKWEVQIEGKGQFSQNRFFATPLDILGADATYNLDPFINDFDKVFNDLQAPHKTIKVGDPFQYHYQISQQQLGLTMQFNYEDSGFNAHATIQGQYQAHRRQGLFQNGRYSESSLGRGTLFSLWTGGTKASLSYSFNGNHHLSLGIAAWKNSPNTPSFYLNVRETEYPNPFVNPEGLFVGEVNYRWIHPQWRSRLTVYGSQQKSGNQQGFYFADGIRGDQAFFVIEHLNNIDALRLGIEFAGRYQPVESISFLWAAAVAASRFTNNPNLIQHTSPTEAATLVGFEKGTQFFGPSYLKNYPLSNGPQRAFSIGFSYNDPNYWRMGLHVNHFSKAFVSVNAFRRTQNFHQDIDKQPFANYNAAQAKQMLTTEQLPSYFTVNATASKSWRLGRRYLGFFVSVQNLLDTVFKSGGFEQARNANYPTLLADFQRSYPLFASKYWWGRGTTYFLSTYLRY